MKKLDVFYDIMIKKLIISVIYLFCSFCCSAEELVIWATADMHGNIISHNGGMARILGILEAKRKPDDILVDAGDLLQGTYCANASGGSVIVNAFNTMNYDFYVPGNHEFEYGIDRLLCNFQKLKSVILCANWHFVPPLKNMKPWQIVTRKGRRTAFIGLGERESRTRIMQDGKIVFADEEKALAGCLREIRKEGVDLIVLVRHGGIYFSGGTLYNMLKKFPEIDIVIGAHSHQLERGRKIAGAYYVQPGMHAGGIIEVRVSFSDSGKIERITSEYHEASENIHPSENMSSLIALDKRMMKDARRKTDIKLPVKIKNTTDIQRYLLAGALKKLCPADADLFFLENTAYEWRGILSKYFIYRIFPYENNIVSIPVSRREYVTIAGECRKYADKYKVKMYVSEPPAAKRYFILRTSTFVLSGGGRNFPGSRNIAEKRMKEIKEYISPRRAAELYLGL